MKPGQRLSVKQFILSHFFILIFGLIFLAGLYYILNSQYQKSNTPFSTGPVTTPPKSLRLDLEQPDDDSLVFQPAVTISGQTAPFADILIYTDTDDFVIQSKQNGAFSTVWNLDEGVNNFTIAVFDSSGESKAAERTIYYSKEKI